MAISVDYSAWPYLITIPKSDLTLDEGTKYTITVDQLWILLRDYADNAEAAGYPNTYRRIEATASTPAITEVNDPAYAAQFEDGAYSVDIINGNTNFRDVEVKNQVSVGTNNTTGFIDPQFLELGLFGGYVCIDPQNVTGNAVAGTGTLSSGAVIGTRQAPSSNAADALSIATERGLNKFNLMSDLTLTTGDYSSGYTWTADRRQIKLTAQSAADVSGNSMDSLTITGEMDGLNNVERCDVEAVTNISGNLFQCGLSDTLGVTGTLEVVQCYSNIEGSGYPKLTGIGTNIIIVRDMRGSIGLDGITGGIHSVGVYGGRVVLESTCTGGTVHFRGDPYTITDNSTGTTGIDETGTAAVWQYVVDGTFTAQEILRLVASAAAAKVSGMDVQAPVFRDVSDSKNRITATTDAFGNRSVVTLDAS
jgi:hypothetical protein